MTVDGLTLQAAPLPFGGQGLSVGRLPVVAQGTLLFCLSSACFSSGPSCPEFCFQSQEGPSGSPWPDCVTSGAPVYLEGAPPAGQAGRLLALLMAQCSSLQLPLPRSALEALVGMGSLGL